MKIAVIGADGQLGTDLLKHNPSLIPLTLKDLDICNLDQCRKVFSEIKPEVVINTAAYHHVDDCEDHADLALKVNVIGPRNLAIVCKELNIELVHISTDYVFAGDKMAPYSEDEQPKPQSTYGVSKLAGEQMVQYLLPKHYIVRTCGLYGTAGCLGKGGTNFVEGMVKRAKSGQALKVVNDEFVGPTYTYDLAQKLLEIIKLKSYGLYHITNSGVCSWYDFAKKIFDLMGLKVDLSPTTGAEFKAKAKRPSYSVLAHQHLKLLGIDNLRSWDLALKAYLIEKQYIS
jgi:dTDP-4-dehydrorhamnose reductase